MVNKQNDRMVEMLTGSLKKSKEAEWYSNKEAVG